MYKNVVVGGTFDHLHKGHKKLLSAAFAQAQHVNIGITTEKLFQQKMLAEQIESYALREEGIRKFLKEKQLLGRATIIPIDSIYGNTLDEDTHFEAIFVTKENLPNVRLINQKRQEIGFTPLHVVTVAYELDMNGDIISSERIRKGEIDRTGYVYRDLFRKPLVLPEHLRATLQKPLGEIITTTDNVLKVLRPAPSAIIAVGDIITQELQKAGRRADIAIVDGKTRRHTLSSFTKSSPSFKAKNTQGTIQPQAVTIIQQALQTYLKTKEKQTIAIEGEEDLLALPAILLAPLGAVVLYGQFDQGVVVNRVTEQIKRKVINLLKQFTE